MSDSSSSSAQIGIINKLKKSPPSFRLLERKPSKMDNSNNNTSVQDSRKRKISSLACFEKVTIRKKKISTSRPLASIGNSYSLSSHEAALESFKSSFNRTPVKPTLSEQQQDQSSRERDMRENYHGKIDNPISKKIQEVTHPGRVRFKSDKESLKPTAAMISDTEIKGKRAEIKDVQVEKRVEMTDKNEEDDEDEDLVSGTWSQNNLQRINAKKLRIERTFQMVQTPKALFHTQRKFSQIRRQNQEECQKALNRFLSNLEFISERHTKNTNIFQMMMESINKGTKQMTENFKKIQETAETCVQNMAEVIESHTVGLRNSEKAIAETFEREIKKLESKVLEQAQNYTIDNLENVLKYI